MSDFPAIAHIALTVRDLDASTAWYNRVFDAEPIFEMNFDDFDRRVYQLPNGQVLGITRHKTGDPGRFDPTVVGLDHVGFVCAGLDELQAWETRLAERGVHTGGVQHTAHGTILSFSDPDGNAFDFFLPAGTTAS
jgi:catechol 2,3-dioxygenase-like lactoylglutathione lyase family enzyme